ncbi:MAG: S8 family serine peptidase [Candidatus Kapaibacterium sp.]
MHVRSAAGLFRIALLPFVLLMLFAGEGTARAQRRPSSVIVRLKPGISVRDANASLIPLVAGFGARPATEALFARGSGRTLLDANRLDRYLVISGGNGDITGLVSALEGSPVIEEAFPNAIYHIDQAPDDSLYGDQWALRTVEAEGAWAITKGDSSIIVGVVDTGIDFNHPDLLGALAINPREDRNHNGRFDAWWFLDTINGVSGDIDGVDQDGDGYADDVIGYDFVSQSVQNVGDWADRDPVPADEHGHGTGVAGVIAARGNNHIGITGLAPGVRVLAVRAFDKTGNGEDDDISAAIVYAADRGVKVLNLSFGDFYASPLLHDAIRYAYAKGVTVVTSSGNESGSDPHYPANFPEVMSVGATGESDGITSFSTFGSQLSLTAPGSRIYTTALNGRYARLDGTSFSSPYVAATAALLLSLHPTWSPDEVRAAIELSADDRGTPGWDVKYGAGRLNARRALEMPGPPSVTILSPATDLGLRGDTSLPVIGSAMSPLLDTWGLDIGNGDDPDVWTPITASQKQGRVVDRLGDLHVDAAARGIYTLRLRLAQTNGHETQRRVRLFLNQTRPALRDISIRNVWRYGERAVAMTLNSDQPTRATIWIRRADRPDDRFRPVELEPERTGWVRRHIIMITSDEMERDIPYLAYVVAENASGDTAMVGSPAAPLTITREREAFTDQNLTRKPYDLPFGYTLNAVAQFFGDGHQCLALNRFEDGDYGRLFLYSFNGKEFVARDSTRDSWLPRGFGDSNGDGLMEVLVQAGGRGGIYEQPAGNASPFGKLAYADTTSSDFWACGFHDFDGDGKDEVVARTNNRNPAQDRDPVYYIARRNGTSLTRIAELPNPTLPSPEDTQNNFSVSVSAFGDFFGNGRQGVLFGDDDADFLLYERMPDGAFRKVWADTNSGYAGSDMVAATDIDGDGRAEAIVGFRSRTGYDAGREYDPAFWTIRIFKFFDDGHASLIWQSQFAYVRPRIPNAVPFFSGISTGDLDRRPGSEVAISIFPNTYVFTWDSTLKTLRPFWWHDETNTNAPIIADIDGDSIPEIGVGDGERISFYSLGSQARAPLAPAGMRGWAISDSSAYLEWNAVAGADYYTLYRGTFAPGDGTIHFDSVAVAVTGGRSLVDTGFRLPKRRLPANVLFSYVVTARDTSMPVEESGLSNLVTLYTHPLPRIIEARSTDPRTMRVRMSFDVRSDLYRAGTFDITPAGGGAALAVSSVVSGDDSSLVVTLGASASGDTLIVRPTAFFHDAYGSPADTSVAAMVIMRSEEAPGERFIATRATPLFPDTIAIDFSAPIDSLAGIDVARYRLQPDITIASAMRDPGNSSRVLLVLGGGYRLGALGREYSIDVAGVRSADGRVVADGAGSIVGFTINAADLAGVFVYPQPFSISQDAGVTFAGLTRAATVRIFTQSGAPVAMVQAREGDGGVDWNGEDDKGRKVPSGIYLYRVTSTAPDGSAIESEVRKLAIVR